MGLFGKKRQTFSDELALVFDIGSASVGGALVVLDTNDVPRVLYSSRRQMVFQQELDFERFVASMLETFGAVAEDLQQKGMEYVNEYRHDASMAIDHALCVYASPWYTAQTKVLNRREDKAFPVSQKLIDELVREEQKAFQTDDESGSEGHIVEQKVTRIQLNGYTTHDLEGDRTAEELKVTMSMTMIAESVIAAIEERLARVFTTETVDHHSFGMAGFTVLRQAFPDIHDFMFIDVSGEVTDVTFGKDDALLDTTSFPIGKNQILRHLNTELKTDVDVTESLLEGTEHASAETKEALATSLRPVQDTWNTALTEAVAHIADEVSPEVVWYMADSSVAETVKESVEHVYDRVHEVQPVTLKDMVHFIQSSDRDPFIGVATVYCNILYTLN